MFGKIDSKSGKIKDVYIEGDELRKYINSAFIKIMTDNGIEEFIITGKELNEIEEKYFLKSIPSLNGGAKVIFTVDDWRKG